MHCATVQPGGGIYSRVLALSPLTFASPFPLPYTYTHSIHIHCCMACHYIGHGYMIYCIYCTGCCWGIMECARVCACVCVCVCVCVCIDCPVPYLPPLARLLPSRESQADAQPEGADSILVRVCVPDQGLQVCGSDSVNSIRPSAIAACALASPLHCVHVAARVPLSQSSLHRSVNIVALALLRDYTVAQTTWSSHAPLLSSLTSSPRRNVCCLTRIRRFGRQRSSFSTVWQQISKTR